MRKVELVKGDATQTIPEFVARCSDLTVAMLYLDFDIYEPTRVALEHLLPLVAKGGLVVFDSFNYEKFAGETKAARELLRLNQAEAVLLRPVHLLLSRVTTFALWRLRTLGA
jgi:hypothetical protein